MGVGACEKRSSRSLSPTAKPVCKHCNARPIECIDSQTAPCRTRRGVAHGRPCAKRKHLRNGLRSPAPMRACMRIVFRFRAPPDQQPMLNCKMAARHGNKKVEINPTQFSVYKHRRRSTQINETDDLSARIDAPSYRRARGLESRKVKNRNRISVLLQLQLCLGVAALAFDTLVSELAYG